MSALVRLLYPPPPATRRIRDIVRWWERRRPVYNMVVGATGLFTVGVLNVIAMSPPIGESLFLPLAGVVVYGVLANVFYSLGSVAEALFHRLWGEGAPEVGPVLFRQGVIFSVGLTLLPIGIGVIAWIFAVLRLLF